MPRLSARSSSSRMARMNMPSGERSMRVHRQEASDRQRHEDKVGAAHRDALDERRHGEAELAARDRIGGGQQDVDGLGEGPGGDGEIDGAHAQHQPAEAKAEEAGERHAADDAGTGRQVEVVVTRPEV